MLQDSFEQIDLGIFFDSQSQTNVQDEKAEMLTTKQKQLISQFDILKIV